VAYAQECRFRGLYQTGGVPRTPAGPLPGPGPERRDPAAAGSRPRDTGRDHGAPVSVTASGDCRCWRPGELRRRSRAAAPQGVPGRPRAVKLVPGWREQRRLGTGPPEPFRPGAAQGLLMGGTVSTRRGPGRGQPIGRQRAQPVVRAWPPTSVLPRLKSPLKRQRGCSRGIRLQCRGSGRGRCAGRGHEGPAGVIFLRAWSPSQVPRWARRRGSLPGQNPVQGTSR